MIRDLIKTGAVILLRSNRTIPPPLDGFPNQPIIGRNTYSQMNTIFSLSVIVVLLAVLIIKDLFVVRMAPVRVK
jgi:hypothetical protein